MKIRSAPAVSGSTSLGLLNAMAVALGDTATISSDVAKSVFATESIDTNAASRIQQHASTLSTILASCAEQIGYDRVGGDVSGGLKMCYETAAVSAGLSASAQGDFISQRRDFPTTAAKNQFLMPGSGVPGYLGHRTNILAGEAFDNRPDRNAVLYTFAYNYSAPRQDEAGEAIWPTLTLPADQVGFGVVVDRLTIHRGSQHSIAGAEFKLNKIDLMRAMRKPSFLQREKTRCYPIVRAQSLDKFVDPAIVAPYAKTVDGVDITTAPLKIGVTSSWIGLSQTDANLAAGAATQTESLEPTIILEKLYVKVGNDVLAFNVGGNTTANFTYAPQGMDKQRNLAFKTSSLKINGSTKNVDGTALTTLDEVATSDYTVVVDIRVSGEANIEFGNGAVYSNSISIVKILDANGEVVANSVPAAAAIRTAFASAAIVGYDVKAWKSNISMREQGDYIDRTRFTQLYEIPLLSPVTTQRPVNSDGTTDGGDFEALVQHTRFRIAADGIDAIFENCEQIATYVNNGLTVEDPAPELGPARYHVMPQMYVPKNPIDVTTLVDSLTSSHRTDDLQAALVNQLREVAINLYVNSEYRAASMALGLMNAPTVVMLCDPKIHTYLMVNGDLRTLTEMFNFKIVSTINERMAGKVFLTFGVFDENRNQAPHLLNWGNFVWAPEQVLSATVTRDGSVQKETIVQPRYRFVMTCPVGALLEFVNIPGVLSKIPVNFHTV